MVECFDSAPTFDTSLATAEPPSRRSPASDAGPSNHNNAASPFSTRTLRACSSCSQQKLKCSGGKPCIRCVDLGFPDRCVYLPSLRGRMRGKRKPPESSETSEGISEAKKHGMLSSGDSFGMLPPERPTLEYIRWKKNSTIGETAPGNSLIWNRSPITDLELQHSINGKRRRTRAIDGDSHREGPLDKVKQGAPLETSQEQLPDDVADRLTSLPLPGDRNPLAVLAEASASVSTHNKIPAPSANNQDAIPGAGTKQSGEGYYTPLHRTLKDEAPHIMTFISVSEADKLFDLYFTYLHPHLPLLDPSHSSPSAVARRNNFLFNAICCSSAKARDPVLWSRLADFAQFEMERLPKEKNIDVVQGHLIYITWNLHRPKHFELDMTWLRVGLAVRTAIDINLHRVAVSSQAREGLPGWVRRAIARTWLGVYIADRTLSAQLGKPPAIQEDLSLSSYVTLLRQPFNHDTQHRPALDCHPSSSDDLWIAALTEWTQILGESVNTFRHSGTDAGTAAQPLEPVASAAQSNIERSSLEAFRLWRQATENSIRACYQSNSKYPNGRRTAALALPFTMANIRLYQQYAELVVHSFALERVLGSARGDLPVTVIELQSSASQLIQTYHSSFDGLSHTRLGCPDMLHTFVTYAAVSLLRIVQPQFNHFGLGWEQILAGVELAAEMLGRAVTHSDGSENDHATLLLRLLEAKRTEQAQPAEKEDERSEANVQRSVPYSSPDQQNLHEFRPMSRSIDLETFGEMLDQDLGRSIWPPMLEESRNPFDAFLDTFLTSFGMDIGSTEQQDLRFLAIQTGSNTEEN
ncbi:uncharacterized protein I206_103748 [Kwoniella pini CBS 10737]|uniref:Zn(2)-C6 fungal-type domain-containing protein n=1 Tax=Kwoniella pini CBS 10737 TaxID=1296096 RepID=A0A1B9I8W6_9TREE|nr:uncharacterized protein I206_01253 [Kwoniella pini CBS 10737]OCF51969.1 hypothetical protein I206_01253 [Kwoniella pini CBS 10737]